MAAADAGQHRRREAMSSDLERALLCERLGWRVLPHELDEVEVAALLGPLNELHVYRTFQTYAKDMKLLDEEQAELVAWVESLRELNRDKELNRG